MSKATNTAATKRNNRKIHARKFLATPEGKAWLAKKQEEREESSWRERLTTCFKLPNTPLIGFYCPKSVSCAFPALWIP